MPSGTYFLRCVSETTQISIPAAYISASRAVNAFTLFFVFTKLHMFKNIHFGTAYLSVLELILVVELHLN